MEVKTKIEFLSGIYSTNQDLIALADTKANTSLTLQTFMAGFVLGSSILSKVFEKLAICQTSWLNYVFYILFCAFILTTLIGISFNVWVYKARPPAETDEKNRKGVLYFNHICKHGCSHDYLHYINQFSEDKWLNELTNQVYNISHIVANKMKYINRTILFLYINLFLTLILTMISLYLISLK